MMRVCVGGSFEYLHAGHRALLGRAVDLADELVVGVTSEAFMAATKGYTTSFEDRRLAVESFIRDRGFDGEFVVEPLADPFGTAATDDYDAIVVSEETAAVAGRINATRVSAGLRPLDVVVVPMVPADDGVPISSTRIRRGEIDLEGHVVAGGRGGTDVPLRGTTAAPRQP